MKLKTGWAAMAVVLALAAGAQRGGAAPITWGNTGTDFETPANWSGGNLPADDTVTDVGYFNAASVVANPDLAGTRSIAGLRFNAPAAGGWTLSGAGTLTLGAGTADSSNYGIYAQNTSGTDTVSVAGLILAANQSWYVNTGGTLAVSSAVGGSGVQLTKVGSGTLTLSGTNSFDGGLAVNAGTVAFGDIGNNIGSNAITLGGGILNYTGADATLSNTITLTAASRLKNTSKLTLGSDLTLDADLTIDGTGQLATSSPNGIVVPDGVSRTLKFNVAKSLTAAIQIGAGSALTIDCSVQNVDHAVAATLSGSGNLIVKPRTDKWVTLSGANTFTGDLTWSQGYLIFKGSSLNPGDAGALGAGTSTAVKATGGLIMSGSVATSTISSLDTTWRTFEVYNNVTMGKAKYTGDVTLFNGVTLTVGNVGDSSAVAMQNAITGTGSVNYNVSDAGGSGRWGLIAGAASNTYSGSTTARAGYTHLAKTGGAIAVPHDLTIYATRAGYVGASVTLDADEQIADSGVLSLGSVASAGTPTFNLNGHSETVGGLSDYATLAGPKGLITNGSAASSTSTLTVDQAGDSAYSGLFSDTATKVLKLVKTGAGTLTLSGASTSFSGGVTISGGTLVAADDNALGSGAVDVGAAGTLKLDGVTLANTLSSFAGRLTGTGTLSSAVSVGGGAAVAPGSSPGTIGTGDTAWAAGGVYEFEINSTAGAAGTDPGWDLWDMSSLDVTATGGDPFVIKLFSLLADNSPGAVADFDNTAGYTWTIASSAADVTGFDAAAFSVDPGQFANDLAGGSFAVGLAANNRDIELTFTPVPEPATAALLALGFLPLVTRRRRK